MNTKYIATFEPIRHRLNAAVGDNGGKYDLFDYSTAYFDASLALASKVTKEGVITDSVVYPICYTFRHGVELFIKYLIDDLGRLAETWEYKPGHPLLKNWKRAKKLLAAIETAPEDIEFIDKVVKDFDQVDRNGMTFRYPETIDRNPLVKDLKKSLQRLGKRGGQRDFIARRVAAYLQTPTHRLVAVIPAFGERHGATTDVLGPELPPAQELAEAK